MLNKQEVEALISYGKSMMEEILPELNKISASDIRNNALDFRRYCDVEEMCLALALFAKKKGLIDHEKTDFCPLCGFLKPRRD